MGPMKKEGRADGGFNPFFTISLIFFGLISTDLCFSCADMKPEKRMALTQSPTNLPTGRIMDFLFIDSLASEFPCKTPGPAEGSNQIVEGGLRLVTG